MKKNDIAFDKKHIWHPYTSIVNPLPTYQVASAVGCKLILKDGRKLIDGMSSWWSAIHGYNNSIINNAIINQIKHMSHIMFGGITHSPSIELCRRLIELTPKGLDCVFLADSGSVAIEVAIKMALQYWDSIGKPRKKFLSIKKGYHGDTFGAISVCDPENSMHNLYKGFLPENLFLEAPQIGFYEKWNNDDCKQMDKIFSINHDKIAAMILEPIVQGAGGMRFYHPEYLRKARYICDYYGILLIADEIATGFGRTGELFACNYSDISPDIICLGKALTGGSLTLSATLTHRYIAEIISDGKSGCFMHGPTFMGNPLACAAANASIELLENNDWRLNVKKIYEQLKKELTPLLNHQIVHDVRVLGAIGVVETIYPVNISKLQRWFVDYGVWIRPFRNLIYLMPPYIISQKEITKLTNAISDSLNYTENFLIDDIK